jgi:hypothetical protein
MSGRNRASPEAVETRLDVEDKNAAARHLHGGIIHLMHCRPELNGQRNVSK